jgi:hypothetical protein
MDGQRMDQFARMLASGMPRRATLKAIAAALGLSVAGALSAPTTAAPPLGFCRCVYRCEGVPEPVHHCWPRCQFTIHHQGIVCDHQSAETVCQFPSKADCEP